MVLGRPGQDLGTPYLRYDINGNDETSLKEATVGCAVQEYKYKNALVVSGNDIYTHCNSVNTRLEHLQSQTLIVTFY